MSSDQIDPADLTQLGRDPGSGDGEVDERLLRLWAKNADKSPSPYLKTHVDRIGRFEIIRMLGEGGMGRVYLATDSKLDRRVAIKVPLFDPDTDRTILERFRREGRAAGAVSHPNVVAIHEVGDTDQGCYIVSEYVEGPTLRAYFAQRGKPFDARAAARFVTAIARGVQAAHTQGVIHRDLKPSNILLECRPADLSDSPALGTEIQIDGELIRPQVADFGLAGFVDHRTAITLSGALVGTPSYMAPEQITGVPLGPQADVFSLGVILYELVTGKSPFAGESYVATIDRVQNHDPPALTRTHSGIPRDLSAICECAISKEPLRRYNNAGELADDLDRYLNGAPVRARSLGPLGRLNRWTRRHPAQAALAFVICAGFVWSMVQNQRLQLSLDRSDELRKDLFSTATELTDSNARYRETIYAQDMIQAFGAVNIPAIDDVRPLLARHVPKASETDLRGIEWYALDNEVKTNPRQEFLGHDGEVYDIIVTADKKHFISVGEDRTRRYWNLESVEPIRISERPELDGSDPLARSHALALSPDGKTFFTGGNYLVARKVSDGSLIEEEPISYHPYNIRAIAVSRDSRYIASLCLQNQIQINSLDRSRPYSKVIPSTPAQHCTRIDFSADSEQLYYVTREKNKSDSDFRFVIWDIESEREINSFQLIKYFPRMMGPVDLSPDGSIIAVGGDQAVQLYDVARTRLVRRARASRSVVVDVEFSPDSRLLAAGTRTGFLSITDSGTSHSSPIGIRTLYQDRPSKTPINTVAWVDDQRLLTGDAEGRILLHTIRSAILRENTFDAHTCKVHRDGRHVVTIDDEGTGKVIDTFTHEVVYQVEGMRHDPPKHLDIAIETALLAVSYDNQLQIWNLNTKHLSAEVVHCPKSLEDENQVYKITSVSISPDGTRVATAGRVDGTVIEWDPETGQQLRTIPLIRDGMGSCTSYSPDGKHLLCAGYRGALVLDLENGAKTKLTSERVRCAQWISDTQILVSSDLSMLKIMDIVDPSRNTVFSSQTVQALNLAISPDVKTVVTMQGRWTYFWHVPSARLLGKIDLRAESLAFSPDGNHLYATVKNEDTDRYELRVISKSDHQTKRQPKGKLPAPAEPRPPDTAVKN